MQYNLNKRNTDAYSLPTPIRDYFDGVKTGEEGEYEEVTAVKNKYATIRYTCRRLIWMTNVFEQSPQRCCPR